MKTCRGHRPRISELTTAHSVCDLLRLIRHRITRGYNRRSRTVAGLQTRFWRNLFADMVGRLGQVPLLSKKAAFGAEMVPECCQENSKPDQAPSEYGLLCVSQLLCSCLAQSSNLSFSADPETCLTVFRGYDRGGASQSPPSMWRQPLDPGEPSSRALNPGRDSVAPGIDAALHHLTPSSDQQLPSSSRADRAHPLPLDR